MHDRHATTCQVEIAILWWPVGAKQYWIKHTLKKQRFTKQKDITKNLASFKKCVLSVVVVFCNLGPIKQ